MNRVDNKENIISCEVSEYISLSKTLSSAYINSHRKFNDSEIIDLFYGQLKSTITCPSCMNMISTYEPFSSLGLSIPLEKRMYVYVILNNKRYKLQLNVNETVKNDMLIDKIRRIIKENTKDNDKLEGKYLVYLVENNKVVKIYDLYEKITNRTLFESGLLLNNFGETYHERYLFLIEDRNIFQIPKNQKNEKKEEGKSFQFNHSHNFSITIIYNFSIENEKKIDNKINKVNDQSQLYKYEKDLKIISFPRVQIYKNHIKTTEKDRKLILKNKENQNYISIYSILNDFKAHILNTERINSKEYSLMIKSIVNNENKHICRVCSRNDSQEFYCKCINSRSTLLLNNKIEIETSSLTLLLYYSQSNQMMIKSYINIINSCEDVSKRQNPVSTQGKSMILLEDLIKSFTDEEFLQNYTCQSCKSQVTAIKQLKINRSPKILIFQLKRFAFQLKNKGKQTKVISQKSDKLIKFKEMIDIQPFCSEKRSGSSDKNLYKLFSICNHNGRLESGHYTCIAKNFLYGKWFEYDDKLVRNLSEKRFLFDEVVSEKAYLLFYERS